MKYGREILPYATVVRPQHIGCKGIALVIGHVDFLDAVSVPVDPLSIKSCSSRLVSGQAVRIGSKAAVPVAPQDEVSAERLLFGWQGSQSEQVDMTVAIDVGCLKLADEGGGFIRNAGERLIAEAHSVIAKPPVGPGEQDIQIAIAVHVSKGGLPEHDEFREGVGCKPIRAAVKEGQGFWLRREPFPAHRLQDVEVPIFIEVEHQHVGRLRCRSPIVGAPGQPQARPAFHP